MQREAYTQRKTFLHEFFYCKLKVTTATACENYQTNGHQSVHYSQHTHSRCISP